MPRRAGITFLTYGESKADFSGNWPGWRLIIKIGPGPYDTFTLRNLNRVSNPKLEADTGDTVTVKSHNPFRQQ